MALGNVGKGTYADFAGKRKLLLVPYVAAVRDDAELTGLIAAYWEEAFAQVAKLEEALGAVRHVFHEGSVGEGDESAKVIEQGNPAGFPHVHAVVERGATLEATEDVEVLAETLDLHRCIAVVQASRGVQGRLIEWFEEARQRRYAFIARRISEAMEPDSVGLLVISPDHRVHFGADVGVIYVAPPTLDRINSWLRDYPPGPAPEPTSEGDGGGGRALGPPATGPGTRAPPLGAAGAAIRGRPSPRASPPRSRPIRRRCRLARQRRCSPARGRRRTARAPMLPWRASACSLTDPCAASEACGMPRTVVRLG